MSKEKLESEGQSGAVTSAADAQAAAPITLDDLAAAGASLGEMAPGDAQRTSGQSQSPPPAGPGRNPSAIFTSTTTYQGLEEAERDATEQSATGEVQPLTEKSPLVGEEAIGDKGSIDHADSKSACSACRIL